MRALKEGFRRAGREPFAVGTLFVFHFAWSVMVYRYIESHVREVMSRFPPPEFGGDRAGLVMYDLFLALQDRSFALPVLGMFAAYALVRLVLVPVLDAGLFHSLRDGFTPRGTAFLRGIRRLSIPFLWLYALRLLLAAAPLYWAAPAMIRSWLEAASPLQLAAGLVPWLLLLAAWGAWLKLLFLYVLFALTDDARLSAALGFVIRRMVPAAGIGLAVFAATLAAGLALFAASLHWAGFLSVVLYLAWPLLRIWLRVWGIAAQYRHWQARRA